MSNARKLGLVSVFTWILGATRTTEGNDELGGPTITSRLGEEFLAKRCIYAVEDEGKALARAEDDSIPGSIVNLTDLESGRLGNHFATAYRFLALGYCCKSKLVTLPPKDPVLAPGIFGEGLDGPRHFDFSEAPDVPGFDTNACRDEYNIGGDGAYRAYYRADDYPSGRSNDEPLTACIEKSRVLECEAAYYFPTNVDICEGAYPAQESDGDNLSVAKAGHLVIHVRSGDIFRRRIAYGAYGQPPLSFYTAILNSRQWEQVDILTFAPEGRLQNPVLYGLQVMIDTGSWPRTNIRINMLDLFCSLVVHDQLEPTTKPQIPAPHVFLMIDLQKDVYEREIGVDLRAMLCADALATSRSTLGGLTTYHTRARTVYLPSTCDKEEGDFGLTPKRLADARTEREDFEVIGIALKPDAPPYTVYDNLEDKDYDDARQRLDMLTYQGIAGLAVCSYT